ncbi:unnamed protein product, partial [Coregonus sp. 'balchen']
MAMSGLLACALMAALVGVGLTSPVSKSDGNTKQGGILPQLLARREAVRNAAENVARREQDTQMSMARMERMAHLDDERVSGPRLPRMGRLWTARCRVETYHRPTEERLPALALLRNIYIGLCHFTFAFNPSVIINMFAV